MGLDDMLHAVLLIKFDEFIVILYRQEKISLLSGKVECCGDDCEHSHLKSKMKKIKRNLSNKTKTLGVRLACFMLVLSLMSKSYAGQ